MAQHIPPAKSKQSTPTIAVSGATDELVNACEAIVRPAREKEGERGELA
jgi:hypothetical protein